MLKILNTKEKAEIEKKLKENFGIEKINGMIIKMGEEKLFFFSGDFNENDIRKIGEIAFIERIGIYFAKIIQNDIKLSIEGAQILKSQIKKNIIEISKEQAEQWMQGKDLDISTGKKEFVILKHKDDFLGSGKASESKIGNFIPKSRRLKIKNI